MKEYLRERQRQSRTATVTGIILTVGMHVGAVTLCSFSGLKYIWPPPQEQTFVIDFTEEEKPEIKHRRGIQPRSEEVDRTKPIEIIQRSESPYTAKKENLTPESKPDDFGDIDTPTPKTEEPKLDARASFPGMAKKDTSLTAPHSAETPGDIFKAGHVSGNAKNGSTEGKPNAHLTGRSVDGALPRPGYNVQESGTVVVTIWVDNYGKVQKAVAGADGTTVTDKSLWAASRKAAMETHFTMNSDAPALQQGTITYIFKLN